MNVKQLKEELENLPDEMEVILQKDPEGNGYSKLSGADSLAVYTEDGDVFDTEWTAEDACMEEDEWEEIKALPKALILFPES